MLELKDISKILGDEELFSDIRNGNQEFSQFSPPVGLADSLKKIYKTNENIKNKDVLDNFLSEVLIKLIEELSFQGFRKSALEWVDLLPQYNSWMSEKTLVKIIELLLYIQELDRAKCYYQKALSVIPNNLFINKLKRAEILYDDKDLNKLSKQYDFSSVEKKEIFFEKGLCNLLNFNFEESISNFSKAQEVDDKNFYIGGTRRGMDSFNAVRNINYKQCSFPNSPFEKSTSTIFLHLHCTGGASFSESLKKDYNDWDVRDTIENKSFRAFEKELPHLNFLPKLIIWHNGNGWTVPFKKNEYRIFTLSRDPIKRFVSLRNSYAVHNQYNMPWVPKCIKEERPFSDFINWAICQKKDNHFARSICQFDESLEVINCYSEDQLYSKSIKIIEDNFFFVGVLEHFDASLISLAILLGHLRVPKWEMSYQTSKENYAVSLNDLTEDDVDKIRMSHNVDLELHKHCVNRFESKFQPIIELVKELNISLES